MSATNVEQVQSQIAAWKQASLTLTQAFVIAEQAIDHDAVVGQNWNLVDTDFPSVVDTDGTVLLNNVRQQFQASAIAQAEKAIKDLVDYLDANTVDADTLAPGTQVIQVIGNPGQRIRELLDDPLV